MRCRSLTAGSPYAKTCDFWPQDCLQRKGHGGQANPGCSEPVLPGPSRANSRCGFPSVLCTPPECCSNAYSGGPSVSTIHLLMLAVIYQFPAPA